MAKGYPDFFGTSIWPKYGTPLKDTSALITIHPTEVVTTHSLSAQGVAPCIRVAISLDALERVHWIAINADSTTLALIYLSDQIPSIFDSVENGVFDAVRLDDEMLVYEFINKVEIPFKNNIEVAAGNLNALGGNDIYVRSSILYYQVT